MRVSVISLIHVELTNAVIIEKYKIYRLHIILFHLFTCAFGNNCTKFFFVRKI